MLIKYRVFNEVIQPVGVISETATTVLVPAFGAMWADSNVPKKLTLSGTPVIFDTWEEARTSILRNLATRIDDAQQALGTLCETYSRVEALPPEELVVQRKWQGLSF